jgi:uncharacterized protein
MADQYSVTCDLFTLPYQNGNYMLYAPLLGFACIANADLVNLLADLETLNVDALNTEQKAALDYLDHKGVLNGSPEVSRIKTFPEKYSPTQVTLFPTNQCNLRCRYCYASAGDWTPQVMDWHFATSAIERVIENAKATEAKNMLLGFHGGGEPLFPWELIKRIVIYAEDRRAQEGLQLAVFSATNGVLSERQLEWIVKHFASLNISFDGLPHVQDYHRPLPSGKGSFEFVDRTMRFLDAHNFNYGVRSTISSYNVDLMEESLDFIGQNYKVKSVHFEPLFYCGRCKTSGSLSPEMQKFADHFRRCEEKCAAYGIALTYSGCQIQILTSSFCGVSCDNFSVTPDGHITTCFEVTTKSDPKSEIFFIGKIRDDGNLEIDEKKRRFLHSLTVDKLDFCKDCFAKWHCAGECAAKLGHTDYTGPRGHDRCELNRQLIANRIVKLVEGKYYHPGMQKVGEQPGVHENRTC